MSPNGIAIASGALFMLCLLSGPPPHLHFLTRTSSHSYAPIPTYMTAFHSRLILSNVADGGGGLFF